MDEEVKEPIIDDVVEGAIPNLDDAFEVEDPIAVEDDLGVVLTEDLEEDEDFDADFFTEDKDGNY